MHPITDLDIIVKRKSLVVCLLLGNSPAGNYPEESTEHSEHGESLKSRKFLAPAGN